MGIPEDFCADATAVADSARVLEIVAANLFTGTSNCDTVVREIAAGNTQWFDLSSTQREEWFRCVKRRIEGGRLNMAFPKYPSLNT